MDAIQVVEQQTMGGEVKQMPKKDNDQTPKGNNNISFPLPSLKHYKWWLRIITYILFILVGQTAANLLGRLYFDKGGNSKWMSTFVQSAGFPIVLPLLFFFPKPIASLTNPSIVKVGLIYFAFGLLLTGDNLMYSYGLLYLPLSTYSLLCATQLAFNAVSSFFINSQKFTALILNSVVLLTISACLLAINSDDEPNTSKVGSRRKFVIGFLCTIGASITYAFFLSLVQLSFDKVIKDETFNTVLRMQVYPSFVATCACVVGLFASGEWRSLHKEMRDFEKGSVSYIMTLVWIAITWQFFSMGLLGLIFEVSALFSNVIGTLGLPLIPIFAVVFFHDKMNGMKVIALVLAMWGFASYIYQHYLDNAKEARKILKGNCGNGVHDVTIEMCNK